MKVESHASGNAFSNLGLNSDLGAMLSDIKANDFIQQGHPEQAELFHHHEVDQRDRSCPGHDAKHTDQLPAEEGPRLIAVTDQTLLVVENSDSDEAPNASEAMDL